MYNNIYYFYNILHPEIHYYTLYDFNTKKITLNKQNGSGYFTNTKKNLESLEENTKNKLKNKLLPLFTLFFNFNTLDNLIHNKSNTLEKPKSSSSTNASSDSTINNPLFNFFNKNKNSEKKSNSNIPLNRTKVIVNVNKYPYWPITRLAYPNIELKKTPTTA